MIHYDSINPTVETILNKLVFLTMRSLIQFEDKDSFLEKKEIYYTNTDEQNDKCINIKVPISRSKLLPKVENFVSNVKMDQEFRY